MRDPLRIPGVVNEMLATWEAVPDLSLAQLWALLEARGVALNSLDEEVVDALRAVRSRHPSSVSFSSLVDDATSPRSPVLAETEGPDRRVTLVPRIFACTPDEVALDGGAGSRDADGLGIRKVELWAIVRSARTAHLKSVRRDAHRGRRKNTRRNPQASTQPSLWRVTEIKRCRAGEPLILVDDSGIQHRLGVVRRLTALYSGDNLRPELDSNLVHAGRAADTASAGEMQRTNLSGVNQEDLDGRVFVARLAECAGTVVIAQTLDCFLAERRELRISTLRWSQLLDAREGETLQVRGFDGQVHSFGRIEALLRAE